MIESTQAISLRYYKYSETSIIAKIFTEKFGLQNYVVKGIRNKKSKTKLNLLHPLKILQIEAIISQKRNFQHIKEVHNLFDLTGIYNNITKKLTSAFISEILMRVLVEGEREENIYLFIKKTILELNNSVSLDKNYGIVFLLKLSQYLGFYPNPSSSEKKYFDLESACFTNRAINEHISGENKNYLSSILNDERTNIPNQNRKQLFEIIQKYYKIHHYNINNLKSYEIIESLRI